VQTLKSWPCSILAVILWFTVAQAAPARAPEPQRDFASAEEAVSAFVAAVRDHQEADLRAILGPEGDRVILLGPEVPPGRPLPASTNNGKVGWGLKPVQ
jgi:hypothetical protein